jgi:predicted DNA-binding transcriptional regulator AlpA
MKTYEFSIIAAGLDPSTDDFETRFFDAGCDDATISFQKGHIIVDFARKADSVEDAITSAIECVKTAGAVVERIEPDPFVNLSDIASRTGMSRAAMSQYSKGHRSKDFPPPIARVTSDSPLWDWATVAKWLFEHRKLTREVAIEAEAVKLANAIIEARESKLVGDQITQLKEAMKERLQAYEASLV